MYPDLDTWLQYPAFDNLQELELWQVSALPVPLQQAAFRLSSSLRVLCLKAGCGNYAQFAVDGSFDRLHFPNLKELTLRYMVISESTLHTLLSKCPLLESLVLSSNVGFDRVQISSPTLRSFGVSDDRLDTERLKEVIIDDAPLLQRFFIRVLYSGRGLSVRISGAPKLQFLGSLTPVISTLVLGTTIFPIFKETMPVNSTVVVRTVKVLVVRMSPPSIDDAIGIMKCFPCLQKLYVKVSMNRWNVVKHHDALDYLECLDLHLKKLLLINYQGMKRDVDFANFFLLNAKVLEMVELVTQRKSCDSNYLKKQHKKLKLKNRASKDTQVLFTCQNDAYSTDSVHIRHMHDMSIGDPFDPSLCSCRNIKLLYAVVLHLFYLNFRCYLTFREPLLSLIRCILLSINLSYLLYISCLVIMHVLIPPFYFLFTFLYENGWSTVFAIVLSAFCIVTPRIHFYILNRSGLGRFES